MKLRRKLAVAAAAVFLIIAVVFKVGFFAYAFYAMVLVALVAYAMTHLGLDGLQTDRHLTTRQAQLGEEAVVTVGVRNTRPLPLPWVVMEDLLSPGLPVMEGAGSRAMVMRGNGATTLRYRVRCDKRGYHRVGPVLFESGDYFGLTRRFMSHANAQFITVYPRVAPIDKYSVPTHRPLGETTVRMRIFEDPTRIAGVREYRHGDPLRRVHWRASARTGRLHAKIYDPSSLLGANILLDFHDKAWEGERKEERSEFAVTVAASLASHLAARGVDLGLVSNGVDAADVMQTAPISVEANSRDEARRLVELRKETSRLRPVEVPVRRGSESLTLVMESLARLDFGHGLALADMVSQEYSKWPREQTAAFIIPAMSNELFRQISRLKTNGFSVLVLLIDQRNQAPAVMTALASIHVPVLHLASDSDLHNIVV